MPSALSHAAPALALIPAFWRPGTPRRLWAQGVLLAALPDLDIAMFALGFPYEHPLGHRGFFHSLAFAALVAALVAWRGYPLGSCSRALAWLYLSLAMASHGLLDTFTDGGLGVALWSPFDTTRHFAPFRPIEVSPLSIGAFLSARGARILANEALWVWLPFTLLAGALLLARRLRPAARTDRTPQQR